KPTFTSMPPTSNVTVETTIAPNPTTTLSPVPTVTPAPAATKTPQTPEMTPGPMTSVGAIAVPDACPKPTDDAYLLVNPLGGYCLLYPDTHTAVRGGFDGPEPSGIRIVDSSILNTDLWASITVGEDSGED